MGKVDDNNEQIEEVERLLKELLKSDEKADQQDAEVVEMMDILRKKLDAAQGSAAEETAEKSTEEPAEKSTEEPAENEEPAEESSEESSEESTEDSTEEPVVEETIDVKPQKEKTKKTEGKPVATGKKAVKKTAGTEQSKHEQVKSEEKEQKEQSDNEVSRRGLAGTLIRKAVFCTSLGVFAFALTSLLILLWGYYISEREYAQLNEEYVVIGDTSTSGGSKNENSENVVSVSANDADTSYTVPFLEISVDERKLRALNEDYAFYIVVPGTNVQYPVVQGDDNNHYLRYTYSNQENTAGAIEVDYRTDRDNYLKAFKTIILGHNRQDGSMFSDMAQYVDESFRDENPYIYIILGEQEYVYEVFAFYEMSPIAICYNPNTDDATYLDFIEENNTYTGGIEVTLSDHIITLYTCNEDSSMRYLIHAVLREVYDLS